MLRRFITSLESSPVVAGADLVVLHSCAFALMALSAPPPGLHIYLRLVLPLSVAALVCFSVSGLYRKWSRLPASRLMASAALAECLYVTAWMSVGGWAPRLAIPRSVIVLAAAAQFLALSAERLLIREVASSGERAERGVIVAGDPRSSQALMEKLAAAAPRWLVFRDCLSPAGFLALADEELAWDAVLVAEDVEEKPQILRRAAQLGKAVLMVPGLLELWLAGARSLEIDDLLVLRLASPHLKPALRSIKRLADVAGSLCLLALTSPVLAVAALLVKFTSPGPAIYRQTRVGANGKEYRLLKLRTMAVDAERRTGPVLASEKDPRVTPVGRFLRATRIDELPQLVNVLAGQMSLVGPRPERPHFVRILRQRLPGYDLRHAVKPGITGLAQIYGRYSTSPELKLRFDLMYIYNYSLLLDARILFKTIRTVLQPSYAAGLRTTTKLGAPGLDFETWETTK